MPRSPLLVALLVLAFLLPAGARRRTPPRSQDVVVLDLRSPLHGQTVPAGTLVRWTVRARVATPASNGLALFSVDLTGDAANPAPLDLSPGRTASVGAEHFDRPAGIANPGVEPGTSGYGGTPVGADGAHDLVQIGGAQNTFGVPGPCLGASGQHCVGQDPFVQTGVGLGATGADLVVGGVIAPSVPGTYRFALSSPFANTLAEVATPPAPSDVTRAEALLGESVVEFVVQ